MIVVTKDGPMVGVFSTYREAAKAVGLYRSGMKEETCRRTLFKGGFQLEGAAQQMITPNWVDQIRQIEEGVYRGQWISDSEPAPEGEPELDRQQMIEAAELATARAEGMDNLDHIDKASVKNIADRLKSGELSPKAVQEIAEGHDQDYLTERWESVKFYYNAAQLVMDCLKELQGEQPKGGQPQVSEWERIKRATYTVVHELSIKHHEHRLTPIEIMRLKDSFLDKERTMDWVREQAKGYDPFLNRKWYNKKNSFAKCVLNELEKQAGESKSEQQQQNQTTLNTLERLIENTGRTASVFTGPNNIQTRANSGLTTFMQKVKEGEVGAKELDEIAAGTTKINHMGEKVEALVEEAIRDTARLLLALQGKGELAGKQDADEIPYGEVVEDTPALPRIPGKHYLYPTLRLIIEARMNVLITGPAGSGKTTAARQIAEELKLDFRYNAICGQSTMSQFFGYQDANGKYVTTPFREAYEKGGVYLLDEFDAGNPNVITSLNAAIENGLGAFPDGMITAHPDFICVACANTFGTGADAQYTGRNRLDAATLDRFTVLEWGYDETLEKTFSENKRWTSYVQRVRKSVEGLQGVRTIISPRAVISGSKLLEKGLPASEVKRMVIFKGLKPETVKQIESRVSY